MKTGTPGAESRMQKFLPLLSLVTGAAITWIDSRPTWDETGITAGMLLITAGVFGFLGPDRPWLWALLLGLWIPVLGIVLTGNYQTLLAPVMTFGGAYAGKAIRGSLPPVGG